MPDADSERPPGLLLARNTANRTQLAGLLEDEGLHVHEASGLQQASELFAKTPGFVLAIVDIGGLTPEVWTLCKELTSGGVPVVVITGKQSEEIQDATLRAGVHSVLEKPIRKANLKALIGTLADL